MDVTHVVMECTEASELGVDPLHHNDEDCTVILVEADGAISSVSHASSDIDPVSRYNTMYPTGEDWRGSTHRLTVETTDDRVSLVRPDPVE